MSLQETKGELSSVQGEQKQVRDASGEQQEPHCVMPTSKEMNIYASSHPDLVLMRALDYILQSAAQITEW
jgi:hypothetical protein